MNDSTTSRRSFLSGIGMLGLGAPLARRAASDIEIVRPPRLKPGDRVGLVNPASAASDTVAIEIAKESLEALGLEVVLGPNYFRRRGYLAGTDVERASDIMGFVTDPEVKGLWARGGWGSARVLPHLDYDVIRANPKVIAGYSDVTALLSGVHSQTGLVTFHGPFPRHRFSADAQQKLLFDAGSPTYANPSVVADDETVQTKDRIQTLTPGKARGRLLGGNLTVLSAIVGTPYLPDFEGAILFLEDVDEAVYRIDRMLTQLALAGILAKLSGFVFGHCTDCPPSGGYGSLTLEEVLRDHIEPLGIPAYRGALFGHIERQFMLPVGAEALIDASVGTIAITGPAVS